MKRIFGILLPFGLVGCMETTTPPLTLKPMTAPTRIVEKTVVKAPPARISATFGLANEPRVLKAYQLFTQTGKPPAIQAKGIKTLAYEPYAKPVLACAPMRLCVVQLAQGEVVNNIELGDSAHWVLHTARVGTAAQGSYQIAIKPKVSDVATDMIVTTNKRTYYFGLVSQKGRSSQIVNFYYPQETLQSALSNVQAFQPQNRAVSPIQGGHLHFSYRLHGEASWRPVRVFDDGHKTFIQMPRQTHERDLPVLYVFQDEKKQLINYRYKRPYFIVDGLFHRAVLVNGQKTIQLQRET